MADMKVVLGTRGSKLALIQTEMVAALLRAHAGVETEVRIIQTEGDTNTAPIPLDTVGKGWFTKEIEAALLDRSIDLAVHSLKDVEVEGPEGLSLVTYLAREDARDVLVTKQGEKLADLPEGARVGTDSIRRRIQLLALRPDLVVESVRGNVPTRVEKLDRGEYQALVLAAAGLNRLGMQERIAQYFEPNEITPAPGQGILGMQARSNDVVMQEVLSKLHDDTATRAATIERAFSKAVGGGCKAPVGAYVWEEGETTHLIGMLAREDGSIVRDSASAPKADALTLGESLAATLLTLQHASV